MLSNYLCKRLSEYFCLFCLQYFRYLVSVPTLQNAPNFLQSSDMDSYETQHAFLRNEAAGSDGTESPTDSQSIQEDVLIDVSVYNQLHKRGLVTREHQFQVSLPDAASLAPLTEVDEQ